MKRKPYVITENMKPLTIADLIARAYDEGYEDGKKDGRDQGLQEGKSNIDWSKISISPTTPGVVYCNGLSTDAQL